eukprot:6006781-Amphidinium_carterae.1
MRSSSSDGDAPATRLSVNSPLVSCICWGDMLRAVHGAVHKLCHLHSPHFVIVHTRSSAVKVAIKFTGPLGTNQSDLLGFHEEWVPYPKT